MEIEKAKTVKRLLQDRDALINFCSGSIEDCYIHIGGSHFIPKMYNPRFFELAETIIEEIERDIKNI